MSTQEGGDNRRDSPCGPVFLHGTFSIFSDKLLSSLGQLKIRAVGKDRYGDVINHGVQYDTMHRDLGPTDFSLHFSDGHMLTNCL